MALCWMLAFGAGSVPASAAAGPRVHDGKGRIDLELQDAEIHDVLRMFADIGRVNIVAGRGISGRVTVKFRGVPWEEALERVVCSLDLVMSVDGNVIYVERDD